MKVVYVPASVIASEDKWTADSYVVDQLQDHQRLLGARYKIRRAHSTIVNVCRRRREARDRQRRLGVTEVVC